MNTFVVSTFNPLRFANRLKEAGVPEKQAEAEAEALNEAFSTQARAMSALEDQVKTLVTADARHDAEQHATKGDIVEVKKDIAALKSDVAEIKGDIALVRKDMEVMEDRLVIRLTKVMLTVAGMMVAVMGCAAGIARLLW